jgi:hypothetical protein
MRTFGLKARAIWKLCPVKSTVVHEIVDFPPDQLPGRRQNDRFDWINDNNNKQE